MLTDQLETILARWPRLRICVVGDLFLDKYLDIDTALAETSLETGLTAHQVTRVRCYPGAGGTVATNLTRARPRPRRRSQLDRRRWRGLRPAPGHAPRRHR